MCMYCYYFIIKSSNYIIYCITMSFYKTLPSSGRIVWQSTWRNSGWGDERFTNHSPWMGRTVIGKPVDVLKKACFWKHLSSGSRNKESNRFQDQSGYFVETMGGTVPSNLRRSGDWTFDFKTRLNANWVIYPLYSLI